jgi:hypothetical protein
MDFRHRIGLEGSLIDRNVPSFNAQGLSQVSLGGVPNAKPRAIDESQKCPQKAISN